jgi:hypothetical protein
MNEKISPHWLTRLPIGFEPSFAFDSTCMTRVEDATLRSMSVGKGGERRCATGHAVASRVIAIVGLALATITGGCANVAAYERGKLAHPTMVPSDAASVARDHVYAVQEGAMGGSLGAASGCGCN